MSTRLTPPDATATAPTATTGASTDVPALNAPAVLPIADTAALRQAASLAATGRPIGLFLGGLCVALGDGGDPAFAQWTTRSKGEGRIGHPSSPPGAPGSTQPRS